MKTRAVPYALVFVTTGEMPSLSSLHVSQVLEPAAVMAAEGHDVTWLAAIPFASWLKDTMFRGRRVALAREACQQRGVGFEQLVVPLSIGGALSFLCRGPVLRWAASRLRRHFRLRMGKPTVFHCRSYYAAHLAADLKKLSGEDQWRVSFDMRSILPEEFPLTLGWLGTVCYGFAKRWEHALLHRCDASFLPLEFGRIKALRESGVEIDHAPIQGFDRSPDWAVDFEQRWTDRRIGYAGSIADWHDPDLLRAMLNSLPDARPHLATTPDSRLAGLECEQIAHQRMPAFYSRLLALVIPGRTDVEDYFVSFKLRCNFFSTKAAEALSSGVPIIVSSHLAELVEFVREHECGAVFDATLGELIYPDPSSIALRSTWERLTANAVVAGASFQRSRVLAIYRDRWEGLFPTGPE